MRYLSVVLFASIFAVTVHTAVIRYQVTVIDENGNPLRGALVHVDTDVEDMVLVTNRFGRVNFPVDWEVSNNYEVSVTKDGYCVTVGTALEPPLGRNTGRQEVTLQLTPGCE